MSPFVVSGTQSGTTEPAASGKKAARPDAGTLVRKDDFLKLLVAQIKNQNPLNPADGVEFLTQLAQFSQLEQLIEIRQNLEQLLGGSGEAEGERTGSTV